MGTMLVALFTININYGFSSVKTIGLTPQGPLFGPPGYEINLLYIAGLISLILTGAGIFSVDSILARRTKSRWVLLSGLRGFYFGGFNAVHIQTYARLPKEVILKLLKFFSNKEAL